MRHSIVSRVLPWFLVVLAGACTTSAAPPSSPSATHPSVTPAAAPDVRLAPCRGAPKIRCGSIAVPLYWDRPFAGQTIDVAFRVYPHSDRSEPALEPVVAFEGGPGYGSIGSAHAYLFMLGPLHRRHDLIVMDQRGTGASGAIDCPTLQRGVGNYVVLVGACAQRLGDAANAYGSAAAGDDLHAILHALGIQRVDLYGDSYGTYLAQVFALHHPDEVRAMVLDGTFDQSFDPFARDASSALRRAWRVVCARTCPGILSTFSTFAKHLQAHPLTGAVRDPAGHVHHVRLTATGFAQMLYDATYVFTIYRDLPAALGALARGDTIPILRLASEDLGSTGNGSDPRAYSAGLYMAVSCHDYPTIWDVGASPADRVSQLHAAIAKLDANAFAPIGMRTWLRSTYEHQLVYGCLRWPAPTTPDPAFTSGPRPDIPVLVLDGELDVTTPLSDARLAARAWPDATMVEVRNELHISALYDYGDCASRIARRFLVTRDAGDTSCASRVPGVPVVSSFPVHLARASQVSSRSGSPGARHAAWVASQTVGDAFTRWFNISYGGTHDALRGGTYTVSGPYLSQKPLTIRFHRARFVSDLSTSGRAVWDRRRGEVTARLHLTGAATGALTIRFPTRGAHPMATIIGTIDRRRFRAVTSVPWTP